MANHMSNSRQDLKTALYEQLARIGKALGNARRVEIIDLLAQTENTVENLAEKTNLSIASVSQHLQVLRQAQLVKVRRVGTYAYYSLSDKEVLHVWHSITQLAQSHLVEIQHLLDTYIAERSSLEPITADELVTRLEEGTVILVDARPADEYAAGHIPGAQSMPVDNMEAHIDDLPRDREIIAYCRSAYCVLSDELAQILMERGFKVRRLKDGILDWQASDLPIERGK